MGSAEAKLDDRYKQPTMADPHLGRQSLCKSSRSVPRLSPGYPKLLSVGGVESAALAPGA